jgi:hypothetical protein
MNFKFVETLKRQSVLLISASTLQQFSALTENPDRNLDPGLRSFTPLVPFR